MPSTVTRPVRESSRTGPQVILQTSDQPKLVVLLTDSTQVQQVQGALKARRKQMSMAALIPGLAVKVEGNYNENNQLVATSILFKGDDLEQAHVSRPQMLMVCGRCFRSHRTTSIRVKVTAAICWTW